ncbi:Oxysterol-binding protein-like protein OBPalpha [Podospora aff. communis PSN243]|uniref:Oxysterol-binding protein-like protein OBPalpha n=1 Tax=Podospora aff. communis PSN243 TaxID=3040156 RepID=A0AAV9GMR8_9PEZI|nr:Oxysterol-binding protein-like protein OBPalpha [Podospora aff. communis PSN243]
MRGGRASLLTSGCFGIGSRASSEASQAESLEDDTLVVEPDQGNVLSHLISQLRPGADLSRVVLPTFILEPRSMLERITNFMCHPEMLLPIPEIQDPVERFVSVVKFYLSGWHIRPPGVKKPLNPILGEIFTCYWDFPDDTRAYYISEQTSHHPPKSSYFYMVPGHNIRVDGTLKPRSKFLGNSAASMMEGTAILTIMNRGKDPKKGERYILTQPNMYARGILFGKMKYELGDRSIVRCPELGLTAEIDFKTKGWVSGTYNAIGGTIKDDATGEILYELSGLWSEEMFVKDLKTGHKEMFFNAHRAKPTPPLCRPLEEQDERESQKLWYKTAQAVKDMNHELATDEKTKIEEAQREEAAVRASDGIDWHPRLFRRVKGGPGGSEEGEEDLEWIINAQIDGDTPEKQAAQIRAIYPIVKGQKWDPKHVIPPRASLSEARPSSIGCDLIDVGDDEPSCAKRETPPPKAGPKPPLDASHESTAEIQEMLVSTGATSGGGPLIDFHKDMKKELPPSQLKRADTEDSSDEFHDARD